MSRNAVVKIIVSEVEISFGVSEEVVVSGALDTGSPTAKVSVSHTFFAAEDNGSLECSQLFTPLTSYESNTFTLNLIEPSVRHL